jgi:hypothetical protein
MAKGTFLMKKRPMSADGKDVERRKSRRFPVAVPVEVSWRGSNGMATKEDAVAREVNEKGGFLRMSNYPSVGTRVTLANFLSAQTAEARVLAAPASRPGVAGGIVIELIVPNEAFWGVDLQVNKTVAELQNLEKSLNQEEIDLRLVHEYREAMDYICKITETLRRLRTSKLRASDDREVSSVLSADRMRRAIRVCQEVIADLDAGRVWQYTATLEQLTGTIQHLQQQLKQCSKSAGVRVNSPQQNDRP